MFPLKTWDLYLFLQEDEQDNQYQTLISKTDFF